MKVEEMKITDKTGGGESVVEKQKSVPLQNGHDEEITAAS